MPGIRQPAVPSTGQGGDGRLTTMRNPIEQTALEALRILDDHIAGRAHQPVHVVLSSELVKRRSA